MYHVQAAKWNEPRSLKKQHTLKTIAIIELFYQKGFIIQKNNILSPTSPSEEKDECFTR